MHEHNNTQKKLLRKGLVAQRTAFFRENPAEWALFSTAAQTLVLDSALWRKAENVGLYMPIRAEVDIAPLVGQAIAAGKQVFLPRCRTNESGMMDFVRCKGMQDLVPGVYDILEPAAHCVVREAPPDLLLVPCVGMDRNGYRLGYGGGYYDRHLSRPDWQSCARLGVLFSFQLQDQLPRDPWDTPLSGWVHEKELVWV